MNQSLSVFLRGNEPFLQKEQNFIKFIEALVSIGAKPCLYTDAARIIDITPSFLFSAKVRILENPEYVDGSHRSFGGNAGTALNAVEIAVKSLIEKPHIAVETKDNRLQHYQFDPTSFIFAPIGEPVVELD